MTHEDDGNDDHIMMMMMILLMMMMIIIIQCLCRELDRLASEFQRRSTGGLRTNDDDYEDDASNDVSFILWCMDSDDTLNPSLKPEDNFLKAMLCVTYYCFLKRSLISLLSLLCCKLFGSCVVCHLEQ